MLLTISIQWTLLHPAMPQTTQCTQQCENNGRCEADDSGTSRCNCINTGYEGDTCELDVNECTAVNYCNHGTCQNTAGSFHCDCFDGYAGHRCMDISLGQSEAATDDDDDSPMPVIIVILIGSLFCCTAIGAALYSFKKQGQRGPFHLCLKLDTTAAENKANKATATSTSGATLASGVTSHTTNTSQVSVASGASGVSAPASQFEAPTPAAELGNTPSAVSGASK